jgi:hypothetical protein
MFFKSLSYQINDYHVNKLPESNPLQTVIEDFVKRRHKYKNDLKRGEVTYAKPKLEDFLVCFQN